MNKGINKGVNKEMQEKIKIAEKIRKGINKEKEERRRKILKLSIFTLIVIAGLTAYFFTPLRKLTPSTFQAWIRGFGLLGWLIYILLYSIAPLFLIPGSVMSLAAGALFGKWLGTLLVIIGANIGANIAFITARYFGESIQEKMAHAKRLQHLDDKIEEHGFLVVLYLRMVPIFPFTLLNYGLALTKVKWKDYALASLLGMLPGTFAYVFLGENILRPGSREFFIALAFFLFMAVVPLLVKKRYGEKLFRVKL